MGIKMPHPTTIIFGVLVAFGAIWLANNVGAVAKIVGPKKV